MKIEVKKLTDAEKEEMGIYSWPVWTKEVSEFDWSYDEKESCLLLEGKVTVTTPEETVDFGKGDFVVFPKGLQCTWHVKESVKKHYRFG